MPTLKICQQDTLKVQEGLNDWHVQNFDEQTVVDNLLHTFYYLIVYTF